MTNPDTDKYAESCGQVPENLAPLREQAKKAAAYYTKSGGPFENQRTACLIRDLLAALAEMQGVVERLPKFIDTGKPICEGDEVHEIIDTRREGPVLGLGRARMIIDDDWDDYAIEGYSTSQAAEAALAARTSSGESQGEGE